MTGTLAAACHLHDLIGLENVSDWRTIDQETVDRYAVVTGDGEGEWIHLDPASDRRDDPQTGRDP